MSNKSCALKQIVFLQALSAGEISKSHGVLLYNIATKVKPQISAQLPLLSRYVVEGKIDSELRLNGMLNNLWNIFIILSLIFVCVTLAAMDYLLSNPLGDVDIKAFEESCGVGIVVTPEQIEQEVEKVIKKYHTELVEKRSVLP